VFNGKGNTISCSNYDEYGIKLNSVTNVTVTNLIVRGSVTGCSYGIALIDSTNCRVTNNTITDVDSFYFMNGIPYIGLYVSGGNQNTISQNTLLNNLQGMHIADTTNNLIVGNSIDCEHSFSTGPRAISLYYATNNRIYHNTFILTEIVTSALGSNNTWDNGFPSGGNYWSNYKSHNPNPQKIHNTELLDAAYVIDNENIDNYPLAEPYSASTPVISILSGERIYNVPSVPLNFNVDQPAVWIGYSLDGTQNITLNDNHTLTDLSNGQHTVVIFANDSFNNMGSTRYVFTVSVPISPILITGIIAVVGVVALIVGAVYYWYTKLQATYKNP
jgi:parallel beta-helix repeat protein